MEDMGWAMNGKQNKILAFQVAYLVKHGQVLVDFSM